MKTTLCFLTLIFSIFCFAQKEFQPKNSTINETVDGDLDGDKIPEKVIIYNIPTNNYSGDIREIQILKKVNNKWTILEKSRKASDNGKPEEYWTTVDFNLSTGKLVFDKEVVNTKEYGKSKNEILIKKGLKINLQNRHQEKQREILLPKTKEKVYL